MQSEDPFHTPLHEAEHGVRAFAFSLCEALALAEALGFADEQSQNGTFFGPNLPLSLLSITGVRPGTTTIERCSGSNSNGPP